jgi:hypothetical protein
MRRMADVVVLDRAMFAAREAANLLRVPESTLRWWLDGGKRRGKTYPPVIWPEPAGSGTVTWGEFVEAGLLRQYRRVHDVKLSVLRAFIDRMRDEFGFPYPLAHERPFVGAGPSLVRRIQDDVALDAELCLAAEANGSCS